MSQAKDKPNRKDQVVAVITATAMCLGVGVAIEGVRAHMEGQQPQEGQQR